MKVNKKPFFSRRLQNYVYTIKLKERNEVYETVLLMFLNGDLRNEIERLIDYNMQFVEHKGKKINFEIHGSSIYTQAINQVCKSKYFKENFSSYEIRRKKENNGTHSHRDCDASYTRKTWQQKNVD